MAVIYFAGSEDIDFTLFGAARGYTGGFFRAAWQRANVTPSNSGSQVQTVADPPTDRIQTAQFTSVSAFWTHANLYPANILTAQANAQVMRWLDSGGTCRLCIRVVSGTSPATWGVFTRNAAGTFTQVGSTFAPGLAVTALNQIDVNINYAASGTFTVYVGTTQVFTYSGNLLTDSATSLARVELSDYANEFNGAYFYWSEVIISDSDTRSMNLWLMNSNTSGTATQWTGTANSVNSGKSSIDDSTFISSATAAQINDYKPSGGGGAGGIALPSGTYNVLAVVQSVRALVDTTGPQHVQIGFNFNGTRYWGSSYSPALVFGNFANQIWPTNPNTSVAWTIGDITSSTFNYSIQSVA